MTSLTNIPKLRTFSQRRLPQGARLVVVARSLGSVMDARLARKGLEIGLGQGGGTVIRSLPVNNGGDGFLETFTSYHSGMPLQVMCSDAYNRLAVCEALLNPAHQVAAIDATRIFQSNSLSRPAQSLEKSGSWGIGDVVVRLLQGEAKQIHIGLGGIETLDCGLGFLIRLEEKLLGNFRTPRITASPEQYVPVVPPELHRLRASLEGYGSALHLYAPDPITLAELISQIRSGALGSRASKAQCENLITLLNRKSELICQQIGRDLMREAGSGAAGGLGLAFLALGFSVDSGMEKVFALAGLEKTIHEADGLVTCDNHLLFSDLDRNPCWQAALMARRCKKQAVMICATADEETIRHAEMNEIALLEYARELPPERRNAEAFTLLQVTAKRYMLTGQ